MRMIIKDKIPMFRKGYPTVSDKYNVTGGILQSGSADVPFGELVAYGSQVGYYKAATSVTSVNDIAGIVLATNVKLTGIWPDDSQSGIVKPGEAFNLMLSGYIAVELDESVEIDNVTPGKQAALILATGKLTTIDAVSEGTVVAMPGWYFTGLKEGRLAELEIRR